MERQSWSVGMASNGKPKSGRGASETQAVEATLKAAYRRIEDETIPADLLRRAETAAAPRKDRRN